MNCLNECTAVGDLLDGMKSEGLQAVLGELDDEESEFSEDESLPPLSW